MEKKLNNGDISAKHKSIDDHERRRQAEKSQAVEQRRRTNTMDGPRLVRDVMIKLGLQRQPAEREHINMKIYEASMSLEKLTSVDHAREDQRNFELPMSIQQFELEENEEFQAYERGYAAGLNAQEMTDSELRNPDALEGYIKGLEEHRTDLYIGRDIENLQVSQTDFERVNQLLAPVYANKITNMEKRDFEVKSDSPKLEL